MVKHLKREDIKRENIISFADVMETYSKKHPDDVVVFLVSNHPEKNIFQLFEWGRLRTEYLMFVFDDIEKAIKFVEERRPMPDLVDAHFYINGKFTMSMKPR